MPRSPSHSRPSRRARPGHPSPDLEALLAQAAQARCDANGPGPALAVLGGRHGRLTTDGGPMPRGDVVRGLLGFDAPDWWEAMIVLVDGRAEAVAGEPETAAQIALGVDRGGRMAWRTELDHDDRVLAGRSESDLSPEGRLVDVCRRSLGLPTEPPPATTTGLWALLWLDELFETAIDGRSPDNWPTAAARHLALQMLAGDPEGPPAAEIDLGVAGAALGRVITWGRLRSECTTGLWPVPELTPTEAGWLDDGAFARWLLGSFLPVTTVRREIEPLLGESVLRQLDRVLERWDLTEGVAGSSTGQG